MIIFLQFGYYFPVSEQKNLLVKDDSSLYRFQVFIIIIVIIITIIFVMIIIFVLIIIFDSSLYRFQVFIITNNMLNFPTTSLFSYSSIIISFAFIVVLVVMIIPLYLS